MRPSEIEETILDFWEKNNTFQKSVTKDAPRGDYVFYDGPPFATGTPHYGHIVASLMKDMVPRYWTMQGYRVERRWGWDCHGLPIENIVEKEKGFKHKKDIEAYGIDTFNEDARSKVLTYVDEWRNVITRLGRWVDFDNDYKTMEPQFMESVWWVFKKLYENGYLYEAYRSMHICPRCETTLAQSEVAQGYQEVTDLSVTVKLELVDEPGTYLLAWTTTPWTLPGNMAAAVGDDIDYVVFEKISGLNKHLADGEKIIFAEGDIESEGDVTYNRIFDPDDKGFYSEKNGIYESSDGIKYKRLKIIKGKELVGKKYKPLFPYYDNDKLKGREHAFNVYAGNDFVNTEEGTGIVHIAPAFGADDYGLSKQEKIPFVQHVHMDGTFKDEVTDFAGMFVKHQDIPDSEEHGETKIESTDVAIVKYLATHNLLFSKQKIKHSYPHCWRCDSPLLNYSTSSWFVAVEKMKKALLKNAEQIEWMPQHIKEGRFGQWLDGARDWSISRQRFWGSVIPIWVCDNDKSHKAVIGSIDELEKLSGKKVTDLHKHFVDPITFVCNKCGGTMKRIPDVLDCWFESGSMPYGQMHYPFENEKKFEENFPAEFIAEGVDQTRAWFYYLHVLATAVTKKPAFKQVVVNGIVLAEDGKKMSKRLNNYPDPMDLFEKYGADAVRYYLATSPVLRAEDMNFSEKGVAEIVKKVIFITHNVLSFYKMYEVKNQQSAIKKPNHGLDVWLTAKTEQITKEVTNAYNNYDLNKATRPIAEYINELSTWFVQSSRDRIKYGEELNDYDAINTLKYALERLALLMSPVMPFLAEYLWQELGNKDSVHLQAWPDAGEVNKYILEGMEEVRKIVELGLAARVQAKLKVRQPLAKITISGSKLDTMTGGKDYEFRPAYEELIMDKLNIQDVKYIPGDKLGVVLDTKLTPKLRMQGNLRELIRTIQQMRKTAGLTPGDEITLTYSTESKDLKKVFETYHDTLQKVLVAKKIAEGAAGEPVDINGEKITLAIKTH